MLQFLASVPLRCPPKIVLARRVLVRGAILRNGSPRSDARKGDVLSDNLVEILRNAVVLERPDRFDVLSLSYAFDFPLFSPLHLSLSIGAPVVSHSAFLARAISLLFRAHSAHPFLVIVTLFPVPTRSLLFLDVISVLFLLIRTRHTNTVLLIILLF